MSIFPNDNSIQLNYIPTLSYSYKTKNTPDITFNGSSGIYNGSINNIKIFTNNTDALTIDSNQCLYGNATGLTHLQYTNIDGKPTNFQSDWNNTIINKPTNFQSDWSSTIINKPDLTVYALTTNLNNLSTNSILSITNLNNTSTTIFTNLNSLSSNSTLSITNLKNTSTTIFTNLNSLSSNSTLSITNLNNTSTTIFTNLNSLSSNSTLSITNLNNTSTTIFTNLNSLSSNSTLSITNLNNTSTTIFTNLNSLSSNSTLSITNLNNTKQNTLTFSSPLINTSNNITIDLSLYDTIALRNTALGNYLLSSTASSTYATITNLNTKQNTLTFSSPLLNTSNNITIDLSLYDTIALRNTALGNYLLSSTASSTYATISNLSAKQNNLTFSNPFLNTSNTITLKYNTAQFNIDSSGNLNFISGSGTSQWTTSGTSIYYNTGNVGIGKTPEVALDVLGNINALGGTIAGKILMNGTVVNDYSLQIKNNNYTCPVLCIDAGGSSSQGSPNSNARAIGMPLLGIGANSYNGLGDYYAIGLGYCSLPTRKYCCEIGLIITNTAAGEYGDLLFSLRNTTVNTDIATERMRIKSDGNVGIGTINPLCKLQVNGIVNITNTSPYATANNKMQSGSLTIGDQLLNYGGGNNWTANTAGLMLECLNNTEIAVHDAGDRIASLMYYSGNTITIGRDMGWNAISSVTMNGNSITTGYVYAGGTTSGLRINGNDYGNTIYQDAITIGGAAADIGFTLRNANSFVFRSLTSPSYIELCRMNTSGIGFGNTSPWAPLNIGTVASVSDGYIVFSKNAGGGSLRNARVGFSSGFGFSIGDFGTSNNNTNTWTVQFAIAYNAPFASLGVDGTGRVLMQYGYGTTSDERVKTNIKTIENALDKVLLLRGVEYNDIRIEPEIKKIGLIAQEVELIIPEVVGEDETTTIKNIDYGSLVGLLVEAIKELNNKVFKLENILKNNNLS